MLCTRDLLVKKLSTLTELQWVCRALCRAMRQGCTDEWDTHRAWFLAAGNLACRHRDGWTKVAQWYGNAWCTSGTREIQRSRAERARTKVRDKATPVSEGQIPQGYEGPIKHLGLYLLPLKEGTGRTLKVGYLWTRLWRLGRIATGKGIPKGIPGEGNEVNSDLEGKSSRYEETVGGLV